MPRFTRLKGLSDQRRLPRLGKIRLGIKKRSAKGNDYPAEVDYFVVPPEVAKVYGDKPKALDVMVPVEDVEVVMPVSLKYYKASGLYCVGDGEAAIRRNEAGQMQDRECPCEFLDAPGKCRRMAVINVILPKVNMGGVYQIVTGSWNSIVDFQSGMDYVRGLLGRCCMVPVELSRVPTEITHTDAKGKTSKQTHYTLRLVFNGDIDFINRLKAETNRILAGPQYRLPAPEVNPILDPVDVIEHDEADDEPQPATGRVLDDPPAAADRPADGPKPAPRRTPPRKGAGARARREAAKTDPAPADPAPPSDGDESPPGSQAQKEFTLAEVPGLWKKVKSCYGEKAEAFWSYVLKSYFGVEKSTEVPASAAGDLIRRLDEAAALGTGGDLPARADAADKLWNDLQVEVDERAAAASEAGA